MRREAGRGLLVAAGLLLLASCSLPGRVPETVKLGLSAPFEGLYRDLGYEALYAVRLAVRQANEAGGIGGGRLVELVALNDLNETREAELQAGEMAADPGILGVIGGLSPRTAGSAGPEYAARGLAFVTPFFDPGAVGQAAGRLVAGLPGARSAVILYGDDDADRRQAEGFAEAFSAAGGTVLRLGRPDEAGEPAELFAGEGGTPGAIFLAADTSRSAEWIAGLRAAGYGGVIAGGPEAGSHLTAALAGGAGDGVYYASPIPAAPEDPGFVSAYEALSGGAAPHGVAAWCYAAARDLLGAMDEALRSGAEPARPAIAAALGGRLASQEWPVELYVIRGGELLPAAGQK